MGSESDIDAFIQQQKQILAKERQILDHKENIDSNANQVREMKVTWEASLILNVFRSLMCHCVATFQQRKQWQAPKDLEVKRNDHDGTPALIPRGQYEQKRSLLEEERKREYNEMMARTQVRPSFLQVLVY